MCYGMVFWELFAELSQLGGDWDVSILTFIVTWSSFLSLRPLQAAIATMEEDEEELAAALTIMMLLVAKSMAR